ncbi:MAG: rod shape-determining protein MreC [Planctomycetota bacterium]|jgi:rod shape-determining protein MreC
MLQFLNLLWNYRFVIAVVITVIALNLIPDKSVERLRSLTLDMAVLVPATSGGGRTDSDSVSSLRKQNRKLREKVRLLQGKVGILERQIADRNMLRKALHSEANKAIPAGVVLKRGVSSHRRTVLIDCGSRHGVAVGMPVVTGRTLVGVVITAGSMRSRVQLVTDPAFRVVGHLAASGDEGVIEGTSGKDCLVKMRYIRDAGGIRHGDPVLTAGTLGRFPRGLVIGSVVGKPPRPQNGFSWVSLAPDFSLEALESVAVLPGYPRSEKPGPLSAVRENGKKR